MISLLRKCCVPEERIFNAFRGVFFENVSVQLVTSVPGIYKEDRMNDYGQLRLRSVLKGLNDYMEKVASLPKNPPDFLRSSRRSRRRRQHMLRMSLGSMSELM